MDGQATEDFIEAQIQQIERIPVFGPYLGLLAAAQLSFADALGLMQLRSAMQTRQAPVNTPVAAPARAPAVRAQASDPLREAA